MINVIFIILAALTLALVVTAVKVATELLPQVKEPLLDEPKPSPIPAPLLSTASDAVLPSNYDAIFWAACVEAVQNRRTSLDEEKLMWLLEISRALNKSNEEPLATWNRAVSDNVILYRSNEAAMDLSRDAQTFAYAGGR